MYDNFMEDKKNKLEFIILRVDEKCEEAYRHKHNIMPKKLFKYEKVTDSRLKTLKSNQLYIFKERRCRIGIGVWLFL